jgi:DsbC/DsbD-like thiol-disulfide interchange protein
VHAFPLREDTPGIGGELRRLEWDVRTCFRFLLAAVPLVIAAVAGAEDSQLRARLVADGDELQPGGTIHVGVLFEMEPGWHIYWKDPGDSGLSTIVEWGLPHGFVAGPLEWPIPIRFVQPGAQAAYGYEGRVLLASEIALPGELSHDEIELEASVSWLACKQECVPGSAELRATLPISAAAGHFETWHSSLPVENGPFSHSTIGAIELESRRGELSIWLQWDEEPGEVEWFPESGERLKLGDIRVRTRGRLTRIDFTAAVIGADAGGVPSLQSVVVADDGARRRGWELATDLMGPS